MYSESMVAEHSESTKETYNDAFFKRFRRLIEHNYMEELDVDFMAANLQISRSNLYLKIRDMTHTTPMDFLKSYRLKKAAQFFSNSKRSVMDVAYEVGFSDVAYFRNCFKEKYGIHASEYRKKST